MGRSRTSVAARSQAAPILFIPGDSFLYRIHPFIKFVLVVLVSIIVLLVTSLLLLATVLLVLAIVTKLNRLSFLACLRFLKWIMVLSVTLVPLDMLLNPIVVPGTDVLFMLLPSMFPVRRLTIYIAARSFLWIACFSTSNGLLVFTTKPRDFVTGLMEARVPCSIAFGISIALRYVPMIQHDMNAINVAQRVRGRSRSSIKGVRDALAYMKEQISTGLVAIFRHAFHTSVSMEKRAFRLHATRTMTYRIGFTRRDAAALASAVVACTLLACVSLQLLPFLPVPSIHALLFHP